MEKKIYTKEESKKLIADLVANFERNKDSYLNPKYKEANVRAEFIDKFFEALNWDVRNNQGFAPRFREVVSEENIIKDDDDRKVPDYSFRIGETIVFYVEAKKPAINIKSDISPAYQVRSYGYSKHLPICILTDFEEFAIYGTNTKPKINDKADKSRIEFFTYKDYVDKIDYLYDLFAYDNVKRGSIDNFAKSGKYNKGTSDIDDDLLDTITNWRLKLAKDTAKNNKNLSEKNINLFVQKIVDRLIFLRIVEDKEIEVENILKDIIDNKDIYTALKNIFIYANDKYNSGLFYDEDWMIDVKVSNDVLRDIISELYYPKCPYIWKVLPIEVLGSIYENFLGSVIKFRKIQNNNHTVIIETKPEVQKAGGVYYTPKYIVDYIVDGTLGKYLKNKKIKDIENLSICDIACGSGSFLVGAYRYLLNWYFDQLIETNKDKKKYIKNGYLVNAKDGLQLSLSIKKSILLKHIYGVDIDENAVEVAKLSLFLQMLEDEDKVSGGVNKLQSYLNDFKEKILPDLRKNILCGNSLVGTDFITNRLTNISDDVSMNMKCFDYDIAFKDIFKNGGFDIVIGNPPYVSAPNQVSIDLLNIQREYLANSNIYKSLYQKWDLYIPFIEKGISVLKNNGLYGAIVPYPLTNQTYGKKMRDMLVSTYNLYNITDLKNVKVFAHATVQNCIPFVENKKFSGKIQISNIDENKNITVVSLKEVDDIMKDKSTSVWNLSIDNKNISKHSEMNVLGDFCYVSKGMVLNSDENSKDEKFVKADLISDKKDKIHCKKYIEAKDIDKYDINRVRYLEWGTERSPAKLSRPTFEELYKNKKLLFNCLGNLKVSIDNEGVYYCEQAIRVCVRWCDLRKVDNKSIITNVKKYANMSRKDMEKLSDKICLNYILSIVNSKYGQILLNNIRGGDYHIVPEHIRNLPIPLASQEDQKYLSDLADKMMEAVKKSKETKTDNEKQNITRIIDKLNEEINKKVYNLYNVKF